jgi:phosphoribosylformylglycinamidine cyclo-ligase
MYRVFNMGHRMEIYVDPEHAQAIIDVAASFQVEAKVIGHVEASDVAEVHIHTVEGIEIYQV